MMSYQELKLRRILFVSLVSLTLSGCYTMMYPPPDEITYAESQSDSMLTVPDSVVSGGVTIYNQNQLIMDSYYQDPYYYRGGYGGRYQYWDPYYYNPFGYHRNRYWWGHRGSGGNYTPGRPTPQTPLTPRREKDYRRSDVTLPPGAPAVAMPQTPSEPAVVVPTKPAEIPEPAKTPPPKPPEEKRSLRSTQPATPEPEKPVEPEPKDDKTSRREKNRDR